MLITKKQVLKKQTTAELIRKEIQESGAIIFYNFSSAENEEIFALKKKLKQINSKWLVCKNTIFKKAFGSDSLEVKSNNAFIFCKGDCYRPLKILKDFEFRRSSSNRIQGGIYEGNLVSSSVLEKWTSLKPKEVTLNDFCSLLVFEVFKLTALLSEIKSKE